MDAASIVVETGLTNRRAAPWRCSPCNEGRLAASPTPIIILGIIAANYVTLVLYGLDYRADAMRIALVITFHLLLCLMAVSWFMVCCTDPGVPPEEWQRDMAARVERGEHVPVCRRCGLYKPPRSHFDSVTARLTLNMDHFCPWVVNTVGFYNRKFFMLFLLYANATLLFCAITLLAYLSPMWTWLESDEATARWLPGIANTMVHLGTIGLDGVLLCVIGPFMHFHFRMAMKNETTIEGSTTPRYNVGTLANLRSVFGAKTWTWLVPLYLRGPQGDGLHWPTNTDSSRTSNAGHVSTVMNSSSANTLAGLRAPPQQQPKLEVSASVESRAGELRAGGRAEPQGGEPALATAPP